MMRIGDFGDDAVFKRLLSGLIEPENLSALSANQVLHCIGRCVSVICNSTERFTETMTLLEAKLATNSVVEQIIALYCIGYVGRRYDLGSHSDLATKFYDLFSSGNSVWLQ